MASLLRPQRRPGVHPLLRSALGVVVVAGLTVPVFGPVAPAGAAPTDATDLELVAVRGVRVARGGPSAAVHAEVVNRGSSTVPGVAVRYHLPAGTTFAPDASTPGCTAAPPLVTCPLGSLAPGGRAAVEVAVTVADPSAVLGTRPGWFLPPTSDEYDPGAGEILRRTWYHEAGAEETPLAGCWPITSPTPNMDVAGGDCDGTVDAAPLTPDEVDVLAAFPPRFSQSLVRSWQFDAVVVPPATGSYHACGVLIDDGGYLAVTPADEEFTPSSIRVQTDGYGTATGPAFTLTGGRPYRVVMRVSNRGGVGIDNGDLGGTLAGWTAYGIAPADQPCATPSAAVFGSADSAWVARTPADVIVVGASDLAVLGAVESAPVDGVRTASVRLANRGIDPTTAAVSFLVPDGGSAVAPLSGCDGAAEPTTCTVEVGADARLVTGSFAGPVAGAGWRLDAVSTVDTNPADDELRPAPPVPPAPPG